MFGNRTAIFILVTCLGFAVSGSHILMAGSGGSGTLSGTVKDPSGAVIAGATVTIHNPVSGYERTASTDASGNFSFSNIPFNPYHLMVTSAGFTAHSQDVGLSSSVPVTVNITLELAE